MKVHVLHKSVVLIVFQKDILDILLIEGTRVRGHLGLPILSFTIKSQLRENKGVEG